MRLHVCGANRWVLVVYLAAATFLLAAPLSAQSPPTPSPGGPPSNTDNRLYMVRVGLTDRDRATAVARQLSAGGFSPANVTTQTGFRVVSEPLPRSVAEGLVTTLAGRGIHSQVELLAGDTTQLIFGAFTSQKEAEALSQRIAAAGYDAWVREGTVYTIQVGPYPQSSVNTITGIIRSGAPGATVTADPVPSQASPSPPAPAPQAPPPAAAPAPQVSPPPAASSGTDIRLYMVRVGLTDRDRATAVAKQLAAGGFSPANVTTLTGFRVVSEPLPRSVAEGLVTTLAGRGIHSQVELLAGDTAQLIFGTFTSQKEAEALSQRIAAAGYDAWVRQGTFYAIQLGPYPQSSVNTITGIIRSGAPGATVTADPVPSQASPPPPAPAPQAPPPAAAPAPQAPPPPAAPSPSITNPPPGAAPSPSPAPAPQTVTATSPRPAAVQPSAAGPYLIVPGQSVGSVRLGTPLREDLASLGPNRGTAQLDDGTTLYRWFEPPSNTGIGVRTNQNGIVLRVWVLNDPRYSTKEGLHVGSTEAEVRAALGVPSRVEISLQAKTRTLIYDSLGLWFGLQLDQQYNFYNAVFDIGIMSKK